MMIRKPIPYVLVLSSHLIMSGFIMYKCIYTLNLPNNFLQFSAVMSFSWFVFFQLYKLSPRAPVFFKMFSLYTLGLSLFLSFHHPIQFGFYFVLIVGLNNLINHLIIQKYYKEPYHFYPKAAERYQVELEAEARNEYYQTFMSIKDISKSGCFAICKVDLELGETLQLIISNNDFTFSVKARVVRSEQSKNSYGMVFVGLDHRLHQNCEEAVDQLLQSIGNQVQYNHAA